MASHSRTQVITICRLLLGLLTAVAIAIAPGHASEQSDEAPYTVVTVGRSHMAVPTGWRNLDQPKRAAMYRNGDGIDGPAVDETDAPLQIGLALEKLPATKETLTEIVSALMTGVKRDGRLQLLGAEFVETIRLADGTEAILVKAEFLKEGTRRSLQMKLLAKDAESNVWMASAHLVGGKDSNWPRADSRLAKWLEAHLTSLTFDERKFDADRLKTAYADRRRLTFR